MYVYVKFSDSRSNHSLDIRAHFVMDDTSGRLSQGRTPYWRLAFLFKFTFLSVCLTFRRLATSVYNPNSPPNGMVFAYVKVTIIKEVCDRN